MIAPKTSISALALAIATFVDVGLVSAASANHQVIVADGGLNFHPNNIAAAVGDTVEFVFVGSNHSVVQGDPTKACAPLANGFYSGFIAFGSSPPAHDSFSVTLKSTDPVFIYCAQQGHCQAGMVGVINPGSSNALASYSAAAASATEPAPPASPTGGVFGNAQATNSGSATATATGSPAATTTPASGGGTGPYGAPAPAGGAASSSSGAGAGSVEANWMLPVVLGILGMVGL